MNIQILLWLFNSNSETIRLSSLKYIHFQGWSEMHREYPYFPARLGRIAMCSRNFRLACGPIGHVS
jgi:hypothetical protein